MDNTITYTALDNFTNTVVATGTIADHYAISDVIHGTSSAKVEKPAFVAYVDHMVQQADFIADEMASFCQEHKLKAGYFTQANKAEFQAWLRDEACETMGFEWFIEYKGVRIDGVVLENIIDLKATDPVLLAYLNGYVACRGAK